MHNSGAKKKYIIWLVGGETAGHVMPLIAVAEQLKKDPSVELTYIGSAHSFEERLAHEAKIPFIAIPFGKLRRYITFSSIVLNIRDTLRVVLGMLKCIWLIQRYRPSLVFSKGGPVALPLALAAWLTDVPLITHESDAVMGYSNRFMARFATRVLTAFHASYYPAQYRDKIITVGLPLREVFCRPYHAKSHSTVLVMGGSLGAVAINQLLAPVLAELLSLTSVTHITGKLSYKEFCAIRDGLPSELQKRYEVIDFTSDIIHPMRAASLVVVRSSSTIFELASLEKPMILIPLPSAANNHQVKNAEVFAKYNAAITLRQENLTSEKLYETITTVLKDKLILKQLKEGTRAFNSCQSAREVAKLLKHYAT